MGRSCPAGRSSDTPALEAQMLSFSDEVLPPFLQMKTQPRGVNWLRTVTLGIRDSLLSKETRKLPASPEC